MVNHKNSLTRNNAILIYFGMIPYTNHHSRVQRQHVPIWWYLKWKTVGNPQTYHGFPWFSHMFPTWDNLHRLITVDIKPMYLSVIMLLFNICKKMNVYIYIYVYI